MASYCTPDDMRLLCGLSTVATDLDYFDDTKLQYYIDKSCPMLLGDVSIMRVDESLSGAIDGSNTTFETTKHPIADWNYDSSITTTDVEVYGWTDTEDPSTKTSLTVSTVYPQEGKLVLDSAPSSDYDELTANYRYYLPDTMNFTLLGVANGYLAGWIFLSAEYVLLPEEEAVGVHRWKFRKLADARILDKYYNVLKWIKTKKWVKKQHGSVKLLRVG